MPATFISAHFSSDTTCKTHRPTSRFSASLNARADVSKEKLDIYNPVTKTTIGEPNTPEGLRKAARKAKAVVCSEPTGGPT